MSTSMRPADEASSCHGLDLQTSVSLSEKFAADHGDFLLAVSRSRDLGIHHVVPCTVPTTASRVRDLLFGGAHPLGHPIPCAAGDYDHISRRALGAQSHEFVCEPVEAERISCGDDGDEHHEGRSGFDRHGGLRPCLLFL